MKIALTVFWLLLLSLLQARALQVNNSAGDLEDDEVMEVIQGNEIELSKRTPKVNVSSDQGSNFWLSVGFV